MCVGEGMGNEIQLALCARTGGFPVWLHAAGWSESVVASFPFSLRHYCSVWPLQGVGDAFVRIVREDGVSGLFRGATPTIVRAMALNMGMLASNDQVSCRVVLMSLLLLLCGALGWQS